MGSGMSSWVFRFIFVKGICVRVSSAQVFLVQPLLIQYYHLTGQFLLTDALPICCDLFCFKIQTHTEFNR